MEKAKTRSWALISMSSSTINTAEMKEKQFKSNSLEMKTKLVSYKGVYIDHSKEVLSKKISK